MNTKESAIRTNKASGLTARQNITEAERLFAKGDNATLLAWYALFDDMNRTGATVSAYAKAYMENPKRKTATSVAQVEKYLGAIKRAVGKYGSTAKVDIEFTAWSKKNLERKGGITNFIAWAPAGQRAKSADVVKPKVIEREAMKYSVKELEAMLKFRLKAMGK